MVMLFYFLFAGMSSGTLNDPQRKKLVRQLATAEEIHGKDQC